jgi:hypothetical protein
MLNWDGVSKLNDKPKGPCYTFLKLDTKTYCTKFNMKMFKGYNKNMANDVNVIYNGWK